MTRRVLLLILLLLAIPAISEAGPKWYERLMRVVPLETTREQFETLFRFAKAEDVAGSSSSEQVHYRIKGGRVSVLYSEGRCSTTGVGQYDVAKGIVISITIYLDEPVEFEKLNLKAGRFDKRTIADMPGNFSYVNEETGEWLFGTNTSVSELTLHPSRKRDNLKCSTKTDDKHLKTLL